MISNIRQSEISFWLLAVIGAAVLVAGITIAGAAIGNINTVVSQPSCGCAGTVALSAPLLFGGLAGLFLASWTVVTASILVRQTRNFISGLHVVRTTKEYNIITDSRTVAFTAGLLKPAIYISTDLLARLTDAERQAVVRHERFHMRRFDPLRMAVTETIQHVFRWLPGVTGLYRHWRLTRELAADASSRTEVQRQALGRSLVKLLEQPLMATAVSAFSATEERVRQLLQPTSVVNRKQWLVPSFAAAVVLLGMVSLTVYSHDAQAKEGAPASMCPLTRQCLVEQLQKQSIAPVYVVCPAFSAADGCYIVGQ